MKKQTVLTRKKRGPPATGKGTLVGVRLQPDLLGALDEWVLHQPEPLTRPEAVRSLLEDALALPGHKPETRARAKEMAGEQLDRMEDKSASPEERATRKQRLIEGPAPLREIRKAKT